MIRSSEAAPAAGAHAAPEAAERAPRVRSARRTERDAQASPSRLGPGHASGAEPLDLARALAGLATGTAAGLAAAAAVWLVLRSVL